MTSFGIIPRVLVVCGGIAAAGGLLTGCASSPGGIEPMHVSSSKYSGRSCGALRHHSQRITKEAQRIAGKVHERSTNDAIATGVAIVLFWPAAFFVKGDGPEAEEYARLLGERQAIEEASKRKGCGIKFEELKSANSGRDPNKPKPNPGHVIQ